MYHSVCREVSVIVGMNAPMKDIGKLYMTGIVLEEDGRDSNGIYSAIGKIQ